MVSDTAEAASPQDERPLLLFEPGLPLLPALATPLPPAPPHLGHQHLALHLLPPHLPDDARYLALPASTTSLPGSLTLPAIHGVVGMVSTLLLSPYLGSWLDLTPR